MVAQSMSGSLKEGMAVYDADGTELGTVKEIRGDSFKVNAPMQPDYWLRIDSVSMSGGRVVVSGGAERYENVEQMRTGGTERETHTHRETHDHDHDTAESLKLREERLRVEKQAEEAGEVRLGKRVTEHTETVNVPVREERVVIECHAASGRADAGEIRETGKTIDVPVMRERVVADKEAVVTEEVTARKEAREKTQPVQATLRKEELVVEGDEEIVENPNLPRQDSYEQQRTRR